MKKILIALMVMVMGASVYAFPGFIDSKALKEVGVSSANIKAVEEIIHVKRNEVKKDRIIIKRKDLEIDEALLEENINWTDLEKLVKELHLLKAEQQIDMLKTKKELEKYITAEQYRDAKKLGEKRRGNKGRMKKNRKEKGNEREEMRDRRDRRDEMMEEMD